jgi:hypothetical protein
MEIVKEGRPVDTSDGFIQHNKLYSTAELQERTFSKRAIEKLRRHGLAAVGGKYWGQNIIDSMNRLCDTIAIERGLPVSDNRKETSSEFFDKSENKEIGTLPGPTTETRKLFHSSKRSQVQSLGDRTRPVASQLQKLQAKIAAPFPRHRPG